MILDGEDLRETIGQLETEQGMAPTRCRSFESKISAAPGVARAKASACLLENGTRILRSTFPAAGRLKASLNDLCTHCSTFPSFVLSVPLYSCSGSCASQQTSERKAG